MPLQDLPTELILQILSYFKTGTIERLAKTLNKRLTLICLPFLRERVAARRNAKRMLATFPLDLGRIAERRNARYWFDTIRPEHISGNELGRIEELWSRFELHTRWGPPHAPVLTAEKPFPSVEFFDLRGKLDWLIGWDELVDEFYDAWEPEYKPIPEEQVVRLETQAKGLGLEFPKGFFEFMRDIEDELRVELWGNSFFYIPDRGLAKVKYHRSKPSFEAVDRLFEGNDSQETKEDLVEGYILRFYAGMGYDYYWSLFLDAGTKDQNGERTSPPGHCVLGSCVDVLNNFDQGSAQHEENNMTALERELGIKMADVKPEELSLMGTSFEEWAVRTCFEVMARVMQPTKESRLPRRLKRYLVTVYSKKGREYVSTFD